LIRDGMRMVSTSNYEVRAGSRRYPRGWSIPTPGGSVTGSSLLASALATKPRGTGFGVAVLAAFSHHPGGTPPTGGVTHGYEPPKFEPAPTETAATGQNRVQQLAASVGVATLRVLDGVGELVGRHRLAGHGLASRTTPEQVLEQVTKVLVVDDEPTLVDLVRGYLEHEGVRLWSRRMVHPLLRVRGRSGRT
jgi:CheY-like chemotaxis protein